MSDEGKGLSMGIPSEKDAPLGIDTSFSESGGPTTRKLTLPLMLLTASANVGGATASIKAIPSNWVRVDFIFLSPFGVNRMGP